MRILLLLIGTVLCIPVIAQRSEFKFKHITSETGLTTETVNCVLKDSRGYVWIGTVNELNRYDGYNMTHYAYDAMDSSSISGNIVTTIAESPEGDIWIGTQNNGISVFNWEQEAFTRIQHNPLSPRSLSDNRIRKIYFDSRGNAIIGTDHGLNVYNREKKSFKSYTHDPDKRNSPSDNLIFNLLEDNPGKFWITTNSGSLDYFELDKETFTHHVYEPDYDQSKMDTRKPIIKDHLGRIWVGTERVGIFILNQDRSAFSKITTKDGLNTNDITSLFFDHKSTIWIGTDGGGINYFDLAKESVHYSVNDQTESESLSSNVILEVYQDDSDLIWVSTNKGGLNTYSPFRSKFTTFKHSNSNSNTPASDYVIGLHETRDGKIWLGLDGGGMDVFDQNTAQFTHFRHDPKNPNSLSGNVIKSILEDSKGDLWLGTYNAGLNRYNRKTGKFTHYQPDKSNPQSLPGIHIWSLMEDDTGVLWLGFLNSGLAKYDQELDGFIRYIHRPDDPNSISSNSIKVMMDDGNGMLWIGTFSHGLNLFDSSSGTFKRYRHVPGDSTTIPNDNIQSILQDTDGRIWIGTSDGICYLDEARNVFVTPDWNSDLSSRVINGILEDHKKNLWLSTNRGLSKFDLASNTLSHFGVNDGLQGNVFNYTSAVKSNITGNLFFGGQKGFNVFNPKETLMNTYEPRISLTNFRLFDKPVRAGEQIFGRALLATSIESMDHLILTHKENVFSFDMVVHDLTTPLKNKYAYMLEGFDQDWVYADASQRKATYMNLPPNTYTFKVKATNSDGIWSPKERNLKIEVLPPWWALWWFRLLVAIAILSAIVTVYRWRIRNIEQSKFLLEAKVNEATEEIRSRNSALEEQKVRLMSAISDINHIVADAVQNGNFQGRIDTTVKVGEWKELAQIVNNLFEEVQVPFGNVNRIVNHMANGDLTSRYSDEAKGDILSLKDNINKALGSLNEILSHTIDQVNIVGDTSESMRVRSQEMNLSSQEIATAIAQMSMGVKDQLNKIDESVQLLDDISDFSNQIREQAQNINSKSNDGVTKSNKGMDAINMINKTIAEITTYSHDANQSTQALWKRSREISGVLSIIKGIAAQTNMLALNAGIQAAQAGEAGRGFSVVAEEIRQLAEGTKSSAVDIEAIIDAIQHDSDNLTQLISEMSNSVRNGELAVNDGLSTFQEVHDSHLDTNSLAESIATSTQRQTQNIEHISARMENILVFAEQTATMTEEVAASTFTLSSGMSEYDKMNGHATGIIKRLIEQVANFKITSKETNETEGLSIES